MEAFEVVVVGGRVDGEDNDDVEIEVVEVVDEYDEEIDIEDVMLYK